MGDLSKHFSRKEFACQCGCGYDNPTPSLIVILEMVRFQFEAPITITSGCRCLKHNKAIGGSQYSQHIRGTAADFKVSGTHADVVADYLESLDRIEGYGLGIGRYIGRTHVDWRMNKARWDKR